MLKTVHTANGYQELHSLLIYKEASVVEEYYTGNNDYIDFEGGILRRTDPQPIQWGRTERHYVASVNKALTATVAGIALENYNQTPQTTIGSLLPTYSSYFSNANKAALTLHDLMTMQLGFVWDEWGRNDLAYSGNLMILPSFYSSEIITAQSLGLQQRAQYALRDSIIWLAVLYAIMPIPIFTVSSASQTMTGNPNLMAIPGGARIHAPARHAQSRYHLSARWRLEQGAGDSHQLG